MGEQLARLLEAQERYGTALLEQYADASTRDLAALQDLRAAARLARTNAEASVDRVLLEPAGRGAGLSASAAQEVVAAARSWALATLALQAHLPDAGDLPVREPLRELARRLRTALRELAASLREERVPAGVPPPAAAGEALGAALQECPRDSPDSALDVAVLDVEMRHLVAAVAAVDAALRTGRAGPRRRRRSRRRTR